MKMLLRLLVPALMVSFGAVIVSQAEEPMRAPSPDSSSAESKTPKTVRGDVLLIEGEYYVVKDVTGHETRLHVTKDTKLEDKLRVKVGDKVEARVAADGHAESIALQIPDSGKAGKP